MRSLAQLPDPPPSYLPTLDGWRAVAVSAVMVDHARQTFVQAGISNPAVLQALSCGGYGVDLFFAISGFLICNRLLREWSLTGGISLPSFYLRRAFRILPLYWTYLVVLTVFVLVSGLSVSPQELTACLLFFRNYLFCPEGHGAYTSHFWSLSVEEHFYLLWPAFLCCLKPRSALWATPLFALLIHGWRSADVRLHFSQMLLHNPHLLVYWRTDMRLDALLWGCFAALFCYVRPPRSLPAWLPWLLLAAIVGAISVGFPVLPLVLAILLPALLVSTVYGSAGALPRFLEYGPVRWIGHLSYSLYIWQTLFLQFSGAPDPGWLFMLKQFPFNLVAIFFSALVTHYFVERPMIRLGHKLTQRGRGPLPNRTQEHIPDGILPACPGPPVQNVAQLPS